MLVKEAFIDRCLEYRNEVKGMKVLEINDIYKRKKKKKILQGLSFDVGEQEIVCIVAPNGSGKSTTIKCITGLFRLDAGDIKICGNDIYK